MKTVVVSFKNRTTNADMRAESKFINFLNEYTLYADEVVILDERANNGLIEALSLDFDLLFVLNFDDADFYVPTVVLNAYEPSKFEGFFGNDKTVSIVPKDYKGKYRKQLEELLTKKFNVSFWKITFKLFGTSTEEVLSVANEICTDNPSVYFNVASDFGDIKANLMYSDYAPKKQVDGAVKEFIARLKNHVYAEDDVTLPQRLFDVAKLRKQKICTAESMTGGKIAAKIVSVSGASDVFYEGLVTYNTLAKERRLGVKHATVVRNTVVSEAVAYEMAKGLLEQKNCTLAITITGYAGSDVHPSTDDGLCYIGVGAEDKIQVYKYRFNGTREENVEKASNAALFLAIKTIENLDSL